MTLLYFIETTRMCFLRVDTQNLWSRECQGYVSCWQSNFVICKSHLLMKVAYKEDEWGLALWDKVRVPVKKAEETIGKNTISFTVESPGYRRCQEHGTSTKNSGIDGVEPPWASEKIGVYCRFRVWEVALLKPLWPRKLHKKWVPDAAH